MKRSCSVVAATIAAVLLCGGKASAAPRMEPPVEDSTPRRFAPLQLRDDRDRIEVILSDLAKSEKRIVEFIAKLRSSREKSVEALESAKRLVEKYVEEARTPEGAERLQKEFEANLAAFDLDLGDLEERLQETRALKADAEEVRALLEKEWEECVKAGECK